MSRPEHLVMIAGEESGDHHAAALARELLAFKPDLKLTGIGGQHMQDAGIELVSDLAKNAVTGFTEVARQFRTILKGFRAMQAHLRATKPDALILIDYPEFNLRMAKFAKEELGIKVFYYISPQIWAWKARRIHTIKRCVDHMAVILPFEKTLYKKAGVDVTFVGHPLVGQTPDAEKVRAVREQILNGQQGKIVALLPGSRSNEIERHMPVLVETAQRLAAENPELHFTIPVAPTIKMEKIKAFFADRTLPIHYFQGQALETAAASDCIVVASGTASLECALLGKPMCIIYKASLLTYLIASQVIKVKYLGLANLLTNQMTVSEFLQYDCNANELCREIKELLYNNERREKMTNQLKAMKKCLSAEQADAGLLQWIQKGLAAEPLLNSTN